MLRKLLLGLVTILLLSDLLSGQDLHYSQFMSSPVYLNPGTAGFFRGKYRVALNGKNQWQAVSKPYQTISVAFDMPALQRRFQRDAIGVGVIVHADIAGDSKFSTTSPALAISYMRSIDHYGRHMVSLGVHAGWVFRSINYDALTFPNQYNGYNYNPDLPNQETFQLRNYSYFDIGMGGHWAYQISRERNVYAGIAAYHLLRPKQSFMGDNSIKLDMKWNIYAGAQLDVSQTVDLLPQLLIMKQGQYHELLLGVMAKYIQNRYSKTEYTALNVGLFYRNRDAMVFMTGFDYKKFTFGLSYDMNVSTLKPASTYRGGIEFSLLYTYGNYKQKRKREIPCPIF